MYSSPVLSKDEVPSKTIVGTDKIRILQKRLIIYKSNKMNKMKNLVIVVILCLTSSLFAQDKLLKFGIKGGLNYGDNGKIEKQDFIDAGNSISKKGEDRAGFHLGMFARVELTDKLFLRPELQYTQTSTSYDIDSFSTSYKLNKLDMPLLVGIKVIGPLYVTGGPSLQYIVNNDLENVEVDAIKSDFTVGMQFGLGVQLGRLNADIRYERGLNDNQARSVAQIGNDLLNSELRVDSRPNQLLLSLGLDL